MFVIWGRWWDRGYGHADGFRHFRGVASIGGDILAHLSHDDYSFSDLESFGLAVELVWGNGRRGCGVILRRRGAFSNAVS